MVRIVLIELIVLMGAMPMNASSTQDLASLLPAQVAGFSVEGPDALVDRDGLFRLINGGAEVYRALNVQQVVERRYSHPEAGAILVDVFDMGTSEDAYGAYHHDMREEASADIGTESEIQGGNLYFWKGRYYASVVPLKASPVTREASLAIGRAIAARIAQDGAPPDLVGLLPAEGLVQSQVHFFHDFLLFSRHTLLFDDNLLGLGPKTDGLLARYQSSGQDDTTRAEGPALLLVRYPDAASAGRAASAAAAAPLEAGRSLALKRHGRLLIGVLDAPPETAQNLMDAVMRRQGGTR